MAQPIPAHDQEHFAAVQRALVADGLHLAMVSGDCSRLSTYAGALARALAQSHGWRVEAYQARRLEAIVADLMLSRFDAALSRISAASAGRTAVPEGSPDERGCVLFIPDAHALPPQEFDQILRLATGTRLLRLVALFDGSRAGETGIRMRRMGDHVACWTLDDENDDAAAGPARQRGCSDAAPPARAIVPSRLQVGGMLAMAALLLALLPAAPWRSDDGARHAAAPPVRTVTGSVQLAGEPPAAFPHAPNQPGSEAPGPAEAQR